MKSHSAADASHGYAETGPYLSVTLGTDKFGRNHRIEMCGEHRPE